MGETPLMQAAEEGHQHIIETLTKVFDCNLTEQDIVNSYFHFSS
jgi:hypothetical protein